MDMDTSLEIDSAKVARMLFLAVAVLLVAHLMALVALHVVGIELGQGIIQRLDLGEENSIGTWFTLMILGAAGLVAGLAACTSQVESKRIVRGWRFLALTMVAMSVEELVDLHGWLDGRLDATISAGGLLYFPWVAPAAVLVVVFGLVQARFALSLPRTTGLSLVVAGVLYAAAAIGLEAVEGAWLDSGRGRESVGYLAMVTVEEILEVVAAAIVVVATMQYLEARSGKLRLSFVPRD